MDVIDIPAGFSYKDINSKAGLELYTTAFVFPKEYGLKPHENLRILSPLGSLKSRIANHKNLKPPGLERKRIRALMGPVVFYIQDQLADFRKAKKQINLLTDIVESKDAIRLSVDYGVNLIDTLIFLVENEIDGLPTAFIENEFPKNIDRISKKIEKYKRLKMRSPT